MLLGQIDSRFHDFSGLDERLHRLINGASANRFIVDFHDIISLIFHYHYQWNKSDERERNAAAIGEHAAVEVAQPQIEIDRIGAENDAERLTEGHEIDAGEPDEQHGGGG